MNQHAIRQYLGNNLWWGENSRPRSTPDTPRVTFGLIQPDYSKNWGIDISPWDGVVNLAITKSVGASFVIIKGMDGTIQSKYFVENYTKAVEVGLPRSSYAWLYRDANVVCIRQAQGFDTLMNKYPPSADLPPVVDFETTRYGGVISNPNFSDLRKWATEWLRLGNPKPVLYSGKYYMDQFGAMPDDLMDMFYGLWIANYGVNTPNLPLGWPGWVYWQFAATGDALLLAPGTTGKKELDLNYAAVKITQPALPDGFSQVREYGSDVYIWKGTPTSVQVTFTDGRLVTPSEVAASTRANVVINLDGWDKSVPANGYHKPLSLCVSEGYWSQDVQYDVRPFIKYTRDRVASISHNDKSGAHNLGSGTRYSVKAGENYFVSIGSNDPEHVTERDPRTAIGYTRDGKTIVCVVDGRSGISSGVTLKELAYIMLKAGAWYAIELDGGDSSAFIHNGTRVSKNGDAVNGVRVERKTVNHFCIWTGENPMTNGTAKSTTHNLSMRPLHQAINSSTILSIPQGTTVPVTETWTAPETTTFNNKDDFWAQVTYGGKTGWVGLVHLGVRYGTYTPPAPEPEPEPEPPGLPASWDVTQIAKDAAGNVIATYKGTLAKQ